MLFCGRDKYALNSLIDRAWSSFLNMIFKALALLANFQWVLKYFLGAMKLRPHAAWYWSDHTLSQIHETSLLVRKGREGLWKAKEVSWFWYWYQEHTCLEAPRGVKKFAKDTNPLGPSRGSIQSILGHFWNFATTGFRDLSWFSLWKSVILPKHVFKDLKSQNDSLECC